MKAKRLWWTFCNYCIPSSSKRADFARKQKIYHRIGDGVTIQPRKVPVYSELISIGNNVAIARNVDFVTHSVIHTVLNRLSKADRENYRFKEEIGCIEIGNNVMIGSNVIILHGVKIGNNVIVGTGSVVVRDCEPNSVYVGVLARKTGSFDEYIKRRKKKEESEQISTTKHNQSLTDEEIRNAWECFAKAHNCKE